MMRGILMAGLLAATAGTAQADMQVTFRDGAPKDTFTITNLGSCATGPMVLTIDLAPAPIGLIFDVTDAGGGVEVFQPFELVSGADFVQGASAVRDGDQTLSLDLAAMAQGDEVRFTIDLDDTGGGREITVNGSEMAGAMVLVNGGDAMAEAAFDDTGAARVILAACTA
ncbi:aggregation factor core protein MAFp3, isoform C [Octadecabacter sp. G9-8]|uniref:Aggregation factor core protein MAFp3, isoform C n=1 Tax=Octadecabacter dasysiphoniae TaxID=2909341 RepID=A0ABS9CVP8_9RHOB|nr:aggregation factor core protein MAFp3, isoform C [Octadecabacter dasysiphoniae]MCF2870256.1 aggregation factor core protein MAFp3, isoform C [Octadecabacter dasysiphoniae]